MIDAASPFSPFPPDMKQAASFVAPIEFTLQ
jgi:hypothetical protein